MTEQEMLARVRKGLERRRDEIFAAHRHTEEGERVLAEPEIEPEENAQEESLADTLASLDTQEERELESITQALARLEAGEYPVCASCGKRISLKRLEAFPSTEYCARCAKQQQAVSGPLKR